MNVSKKESSEVKVPQRLDDPPSAPLLGLEDHGRLRAPSPSPALGPRAELGVRVRDDHAADDDAA